jgi:UDP-N-acetylmuramate dehydrogenase
MQIKKNEPLARYSTFGIGGPAQWFISVTTVEMMQQALQFAFEKNLPFHILGKGSNTLFDDRGYNGVVIQNKITHYEQNEGHFTVGSGFSFALLGVRSARLGYEGLEFASGIPATVGGAIFMNAGANGQETQTHLASVDFVDNKGNLLTLPKKELAFSYRCSSFHNKKGAIVGAAFSLKKNEAAKKRQQTILSYRKKSQPLKELSCGCVFQNPKGDFAGKLIEEAGLKGLSCGGATVSPLHANFIVNNGSASAKDVIELIEKIQQEVKKKSGTQLESEIRRLGYDEG